MSAPCDVVFVIGDLTAGGSQRVLQRISRELVTLGYAVSVLTLSRPDTDFFSLNPKVHRIALDAQSASPGKLVSLWRNARLIGRLRRELTALRPATVCGFIGITNILVILATAFWPVRVVACERNDPAKQRLPFPWQYLRRIVYPWATVVTANAREALQHLQGFVPASRLRLLPNPLPEMESAPAQREPVVLAVGRLSRQKGFDILLDAWGLLQPRGWSLHVVGTGPDLRVLQDQAERLGISRSVHFLPPVADIMVRYRTAAILVAPSRFEGTPNVVLEAVAADLPVVVSTACGDALEIVEEGVSGRVVPVEDSAALRDALADLIEQPAVRASLAQTAGMRLAARRNQHLDHWLEALGLPARTAR